MSSTQPGPPHPVASATSRGGSPPSSARSRKASTACLACKQRKSKCNEGHPCEACQLRRTSCIYDRNADQRRRTATQKNMQELHRQRMLLGGILAIIQLGQPDQADHLCDLIRHNAALPDLAIHVENTVNAEPDILQLSQQIVRSDEELSQEPIDATRSKADRIRPQSLLLPPVTFPARPWTSLASDEVVSHLLSLYFTWEQPCLQFIDKTTFLAEMRAGVVSRSDGFCSPLLVSAVLAQACLVSQRTECRNLRKRLLREAKVRLELERGRASVTTLQALVVLFLHEAATGRDRIGRTYYLQAIDMWSRLGFDRYRSRPYDCEGSELARTEWRATAVAVWGIFCAENFMSFLTGFEPRLPPPSMERYFEYLDADGRTDLDSRDGCWTPYPMQRPEQPALAGNTLSALCSLSEVHHEISAWNRQGPDDAPLGSPPDLAFRVRMFQSLASWNAQLHLNLRPGASSMAHLYYLQSFYHATHIALFRPLQEFEGVQLPIEIGSPRQLCFKHASESMDMVFAYRKAFSIHHSSCAGLLGPYMAVVALSPQLRDGPHTVEPFVRACWTLLEHSDNFPVTPYILAMLKALDMEQDLGIPEEAMVILHESHLQPEDLDDIPMEMQIPIRPRRHLGLRGVPGSGGAVTSESVGDLLARWVGPSSEEHQ